MLISILIPVPILIIILILRRLKRNVIILQSFIDAHNYAIKKFHYFVHDDDDDENNSNVDDINAEYLPEEVRVKNESLRQVEQV